MPLVAVLPYPDPQSVWPDASQRAVPPSCADAADDVITLQNKAPDVQAEGRRRAGPARRLAGPQRRPRRCSCGTATTPRSGKLSAVARRPPRRRTSGSLDPPTVRQARGVTPVARLIRVGSDTGGTFTDLVADDGTIAKVPSTPRRSRRGGAHAAWPSCAVADAGTARVLAHGTTVATNALLERRGRAGRAGHQRRASPTSSRSPARTGPSLYDQTVDRPEPLVPARAARSRCAGRLDADGAELEPLDLASLPAIARRRRGGRRVPAAQRPATRPTSSARRRRAARPTATT